MCQKCIGFRQRFDPCGVFLDFGARQSPKSEVVAEYIQIGARSAATQAQGRIARIDGLGYDAAGGPPQGRCCTGFHLLDGFSNRQALPGIREQENR